CCPSFILDPMLVSCPRGSAIYSASASQVAAHATYFRDTTLVGTWLSLYAVSGALLDTLFVQDGDDQLCWDFGDGTTGSGQTTFHTYTQAGTYTRLLTVTDSN